MCLQKLLIDTTLQISTSISLFQLLHCLKSKTVFVCYVCNLNVFQKYLFGTPMSGSPSTIIFCALITFLCSCALDIVAQNMKIVSSWNPMVSLSHAVLLFFIGFEYSGNYDHASC